MSNLKLDIIYYMTSSDFEMEFNLSGCYRMRIFKDKIESKKELVRSLARDVSRSKVILVVTDLFGENSAIPTLSRAIGIPLISPNKEEYGINTNEDIIIPETAVPLVTKTGIFGGFIIESGPQSIIIVSNVRSLRHEIMKTYVHNYIFDVGQLLAYQERMGQNGQVVQRSPIDNIPVFSDQSEGLEKQDVPTEEQEEASENLSENNASNDEPDRINEAEPSAESEPVIPADDTRKDNQESEKHSRSIVEPGINHTADLEALAIELSEPKKKSKTPKRASSIILLIIVILLLIAFGVLAYFFVYLPAVGLENPILNEQNGFFYELIKSFQ